MKIFIRILPVIGLVIGLMAGWSHRYWLFDTYRLASYDAPGEIISLSEESGMSRYANRLFLAAKPALLPEQEFDQKCVFGELGLVLGCYNGADIYVLDVTEEELEPVEVVTAAHEMLHVVYSRLNTDEINQLKRHLDRQLELIDNKRVLSEIDGYRKDSNSDIYNEMHSIFGTEIGELIPELESHYAKFFDDRSLVLEKSQAYEQVFVELEEEISAYDRQLAGLGRQIDSLELEATISASQIDSQKNRLSQYEQSGDLDLYNQLVPSYNALVIKHNSTVEKLKSLISEYNSLVELRNQNTAARNNLIKSLDSDIEAVD